MINLQNELIEREKELDCLYEISETLSETDSDKEKIFTEFSYSLAKAMTYPEAARVIITTETENSPGNEETQDISVFTAESFLENGEKITISVSYNRILEFVDREKKLVISAASLLANTLSKRNYYKELEKKTEELKSKNTALKEILFQINKDREEYIKSTRAASENLILPMIFELEDSSPSPRQAGLISQLKAHIKSLYETQDDNLKMISGLLTPRELKICYLIKNGASTKETALYLNISPQTVERHRNTIRKKLGINRKNINLVTHLRNM